jgi:myosin-crossreactive antigen
MKMIPSEYGYNVVMKYEIPADAVTNETYKEWFSDLASRIVAKQFHTMCKPYMDKVTVDNDVFATLPSMKEIATNTGY